MRYHTGAIIASLVKIIKEPRIFSPEAKSGTTRVTLKLRLEFEKTTPSKSKRDSGYYTLEYVIKYGSLLDSTMEYCEIERPVFKHRCRSLRFRKFDIKHDRSCEIYFSHADCGEESVELTLRNSKEFSGVYSLAKANGSFFGDFYERDEKGFFVPEVHLRDVGPNSNTDLSVAQMKIDVKDFEIKSLAFS